MLLSQILSRGAFLSRGTLWAAGCLTLIGGAPFTADAAPRADLLAGWGGQSKLERTDVNPDYTGSYAFQYESLIAQVDCCLQIGTQLSCAPVTISVPLYNGEITEDSLIFLLEYLKKQVVVLFPELPEDSVLTYEAMIEYLFPKLVEELNAILDNLPPGMAVKHRSNSSVLQATLTWKGATVTFPGSITVSSGQFKLTPEVLWGGIEPNYHRSGYASARVKIDISESAGVQSPSGQVTTLSISLDGTGWAGITILPGT